MSTPAIAAPVTSVVLAVPTIPVRAHRLPQLEQLWQERTPDADLTIIYSQAGTTWAAGLNAVWEQVRHQRPDVFVCGSDDMVPADDRWLPNAQHWLDRNIYPCPRVEDPRFINWGSSQGPHVQVSDGADADMSTFPILRGDWLDTAFPLPDDLHYFSDGLLGVRIWHAGIKAVAVPSCRILHLHAQEGRGAGYGTENTRLYIDTARYSRALEAEGIDRESLPNGLRGCMYEPHFIEIGTLAGA